MKIKFTSNICRLNSPDSTPFSRKCIFYQKFYRPWCTMVSIDFVSDSQQMKLYDYDEEIPRKKSARRFRGCQEAGTVLQRYMYVTARGQTKFNRFCYCLSYISDEFSCYQSIYLQKLLNICKELRTFKNRNKLLIASSTRAAENRTR